MNASTLWASTQIGKPWVAGGRGPESFDCWGLVYCAYACLLQTEISLLGGLDPKNLTDVVDAHVVEVANWERIQEPVDLCVVAMSKHRLIHHVGLWIPVDNGVVLHCMDKSHVIAQSINSIRNSGFSTIKYYKLRK